MATVSAVSRWRCAAANSHTRVTITVTITITGTITGTITVTLTVTITGTGTVTLPAGPTARFAGQLQRRLQPRYEFFAREFLGAQAQQMRR